MIVDLMWPIIGKKCVLFLFTGLKCCGDVVGGEGSFNKPTYRALEKVFLLYALLKLAMPFLF